VFPTSPRKYGRLDSFDIVTEDAVSATLGGCFSSNNLTHSAGDPLRSIRLLPRLKVIASKIESG
jgi:hypothetical protein